MNNNRNIKAFLTIGIGTIANIIIGLITTPIITRLVDTREYGLLSVFSTYASLAVIVLCLGLDQSLVRFYYYDDSISYKRKLIRLTVSYSLGIAIISCLIAFFVINYTGISFDFKGILLVLLLIYILIQLVFRFAMLVLRVEYLSKWYAGLNALNKFIYLISSILMILFIKDANNFLLLIIATIISTSIPLLIAIFRKRELWKVGKIKESVYISKIKIFKYGLPFIISMGITSLFEALDKLFIKYYCDYSEVGIYTSAITVVNVFAIIQSTFNVVWAPLSIDYYIKNPDDYNFYKKVNEILSVILFVFGLTLVLFKDVLVLMLGENFREATYIIPFLVFHPIMYTLSETTAIGIDIKKKTYQHIIVAIIACSINALGNYLLVKRLGGQGAAISTGISYIVFFVMRTTFGLINFNYKPSLWKIIISTVCTLILSFYSSFYNFSYWTIVIYCCSIFIVIIIYLSAIKLIFKSIYRFISRKKETN